MISINSSMSGLFTSMACAHHRSYRAWSHCWHRRFSIFWWRKYCGATDDLAAGFNSLLPWGKQMTFCASSAVCWWLLWHFIPAATKVSSWVASASINKIHGQRRTMAIFSIALRPRPICCAAGRPFRQIRKWWWWRRRSISFSFCMIYNTGSIRHPENIGRSAW